MSEHHVLPLLTSISRDLTPGPGGAVHNVTLGLRGRQTLLFIAQEIPSDGCIPQPYWPVAIEIQNYFINVKWRSTENEPRGVAQALTITTRRSDRQRRSTTDGNRQPLVGQFAASREGRVTCNTQSDASAVADSGAPSLANIKIHNLPQAAPWPASVAP